MSLKELELKWEMFPEVVWENFGLLINKSHEGWSKEDAPWIDKEAYRFFTIIVPAILQTAEHYNGEKYRNSSQNTLNTPFTTIEKQKDGFYRDADRPDYMEANEELIHFLRQLSGREKFEMLQKILKLKAAADDIFVDKHVHAVVQDMYATYILEKSLRK